MKHPNRLYFCVRKFAKFGTTPFPLSEEKESSCSGVIHKMTPFLWEVESPSTFRDSYWLTDCPSDKMTGKTMRTFLRWRLRRYLRDEKLEVMVRKSPFDASTWLFHQEKPCWADPGPAADKLRTRLMRAMHELNHYHPALAATVTEHFKKEEDPYTPSLLDAAFNGEEKYEYDRSIYGNEPVTVTENEAETVMGGVGMVKAAVNIMSEILNRPKIRLVTVLPDEPTPGVIEKRLAADCGQDEIAVAEPEPELIEKRLAEDCGLVEIEVSDPDPEEVAKRLAEDCERAGTLQVQGHSEESGA